jgi:cytochrome c-type biogenesis protein CcmH/NrfG
METSFRTSGKRVHAALTVALLAACAANLVLVCSWLSG